MNLDDVNVKSGLNNTNKKTIEQIQENSEEINLENENVQVEEEGHITGRISVFNSTEDTLNCDDISISPPPKENVQQKPKQNGIVDLNKYFNLLQDKEVDVDKLAKDFYKIADDIEGIQSVEKMQELLDKNINSENITEFLDSYENNRQGDTSIIDTIVSETGASNDERKQALNTIMDNLIDNARRKGVSEKDIQKAKDDFQNSMDKEFGALFRKINPNDMEKAVDFLRGAIAVKNVSNIDNMEFSEADAIQMFKSTLKEETKSAEEAFQKARDDEDWAAQAGDNILGLFGCTTIEDMRSKLGDNAKSVEKLMNSKNDKEFKKNYKEVFGVEFDKKKIIARENALQKYQEAEIFSQALNIFDEILQKTSSYDELILELKNKLNCDDSTIDKIIKQYGNKFSSTDEEKKEALVKYLNERKTETNKKFKEIANGKTIEQLKKDVDVLTQSALGTSNIAKDVALFNENQVLTGMVVEAGAEIAATIALQAVPGLGQAAAARLAVSAAKWGKIGIRLANMANKTEKGLSTITKLQQGASFETTALNNVGKIGYSMATSGTATMAVDLSNGKSVEEATKKALMNMSFSGVGTSANMLAPKLIETFGIVDTTLAREIAEELINAAGSYGITTLSGGEYGEQDAFIDFASGMIMARFAHQNHNIPNKQQYDVDFSYGTKDNQLQKNKIVKVNSDAKLTLGSNYELDLNSEEFKNLKDGEFVLVGRNGQIKVPNENSDVSRHHLLIRKSGDSFLVTDISKNGTKISSAGKSKIRNIDKELNVESYRQSTNTKLLELKNAGVIGDIDLTSYVAKNAQINPELKTDIDRMYAAYRQGIKPIDVFVPKMKDEKHAFDSLKTGDLCVINGSNKVSIKSVDGTIKELNISPEKYMELFPPIERYSFQQQKAGDCYLVAALYAMQSSPAAREKFLTSFIENVNGSSAMKFNNGNFKFDNVTRFAVSSDQMYLVKGAKGIKNAEYAYGQALRYDRVQELADTLSSPQKMAYHNEIVKINEEKIKILDDLLNGKYNNCSSNKFKQIFLNRINALVKNTTYYDEHIVDLIFEDIVKGSQLNIHQGKIFEIKEAVNDVIKENDIKGQYEELCINPNAEYNLRGHGGKMENVMKKFGLNAQSVDISSGLSILKNTNNWNNHVFTVGSLHGSDRSYLDPDRYIAKGHAYCIQPFKNQNGEILFRVTNPWNTSCSNIMTEQEILQYFETLQYAKVK